MSVDVAQRVADALAIETANTLGHFDRQVLSCHPIGRWVAISGLVSAAALALSVLAKPTTDSPETDGAARVGRRPEGCARAIDDLLRERGPLTVAEMDAALNSNGKSRHGLTTIKRVLGGLMDAGLVVKTARGVYELVSVG